MSAILVNGLKLSENRLIHLGKSDFRAVSGEILFENVNTYDLETKLRRHPLTMTF